MKQTVLASALLTAMMATSAQADTLLGFKVGGDVWQADTSGEFLATPKIKFDSSTQGSLWVSLEHPVPLVPNVMIRQNILKQDTTLEDKTYKTDQSNTDLILYYEILDNDLVSLDVGGAYKIMQGEFKSIETIQADLQNISKDLDKGILMGYANAMVGVPGIGLFAFADVMTGLNETKVHDYQLGLGWQFDSMLVDTRIRTGYREFDYNVDATDTTFKGFFAGVELDF